MLAPKLAVSSEVSSYTFADIDMETLLIDPADIKRKITSKTRAILVVHLYGFACDFRKIIGILS